ncbi:hypothetical protein [Nonomuraea helvata]|uniref:Uncharacterized protein n=1 Tax=Nonomuraea helvata TaxID=37484 RepID=A0ABV5S5Q1_9ACTN
MGHSVRTISEAVRTFLTFDMDALTFKAIRPAPGGRANSSSSGQEFLEGLEFQLEGDWYSGHISISPGSDAKEDFYFDSAHLTIPTHGKFRGNWFFSIDETEAQPSEPPAKFKGNYSHNGKELPEQVRGDIVKLLEKIGIFH